MAQITTTGNSDIDTATAEIAVALRDADLGTVHGPLPEQHFYDEAMRLRDAIMAGTRELDAPEPPLEDFTVAAPDGSQDYLWNWLEHGQDEA